MSLSQKSLFRIVQASGLTWHLNNTFLPGQEALPEAHQGQLLCHTLPNHPAHGGGEVEEGTPDRSGKVSESAD